MPTSTKAALIAIGGLGTPSKMPGHAYGISASRCITGSKLAQIPGSVCYGCFALRGQYTYPVVKQAHANRLASLTTANWVANMATAIIAKKDNYFRWHDSGDLQSVGHLSNICAVSRLTPNVKHWLPTREYKFVTDYLKLGGLIPSNLTIRLSAHMIDGAPPSRYGLPTSTVSEHSDPIGHDCPARLQGNQCGNCRACWDSNIRNVNYHKH